VFENIKSSHKKRSTRTYTEQEMPTLSYTEQP